MKGLTTQWSTAPTNMYKRSNYYIEENDALRLFKFKKKNLLQLAGDKADEIEAYAKKYKLSFKKEIDVSRMFSYHLKE